ncbi:cytochrome c551 peroxidase [Flammeovirgaceae bacterium 311]|nr:cytochrome c551 peroxidase [Flammeovirgaceae bacterium 311]
MTISSRSSILLFILSFSLLLTASSCSTENQQEEGLREEGSVENEYAQIFEPIPKEVKAPEDNPMTEESIDLGHMLFFENRLSRSGVISCNSCHVVGAAGVDHRTIAMGDSGRTGPRNSPTVFNAAFLEAQFWDGRVKTLEDQAKGPIQAHVEMDLTPEEAMQRLERSGYRPYFEAAFPNEEDPFTFDNLAKAIASFERTLITPGSPFDRFLAGEEEALNEQQKAGLELFMQSGCISCHNGPLLGGRSFMPFTHAKDKGGEDKGVYALTGKESDKYVFRVAPLRNVQFTYPYFHDGSAETLEEAITIMGKSQLNRQFSEEEVTKLVAYLESLSGEFPMVTHPRLPR